MNWNDIVVAIDIEVNEVKNSFFIKNEIIRGDVFTILENKCIVLYYPVEGTNNCGFHIKRFIKDELKDIVYINTAKSLGEQVFAAAHELGHIWEVGKKVWKRIGEKENLETDLEEDITNRFAAELLLPKKVFIETFKTYRNELGSSGAQIDEETLIRIIAKQMNTFQVPYVAVRKRIHEVGIISDKVNEDLKQNDGIYSEKAVIYCNDQNSYVGEKTNKKTVSQLRQLLDEAAEKKSLDELTLLKIKRDFEIAEPSVNKNSYYDMAGESENV